MKCTNFFVLGLALLLLCCSRKLKKKDQILYMLKDIYLSSEQIHQNIISDLSSCSSVNYKIESFKDFKELMDLEANQLIIENFNTNKMHNLYNKNKYLDMLHKYLSVVSFKEKTPSEGNIKKKEVLLLAGEHPRELITVNLAAYLIKQFCTNEKFQ